MRRNKKPYITAHLKLTEIALIEEISSITGKRKTDIVNEAVRAYLEPYKELYEKALDSYREEYSAALTQHDTHSKTYTS